MFELTLDFERARALNAIRRRREKIEKCRQEIAILENEISHFEGQLRVIENTKNWRVSHAG